MASTTCISLKFGAGLAPATAAMNDVTIDDHDRQHDVRDDGGERAADHHLAAEEARVEQGRRVDVVAFQVHRARYSEARGSVTSPIFSIPPRRTSAMTLATKP